MITDPVLKEIVSKALKEGNFGTPTFTATYKGKEKREGKCLVTFYKGSRYASFQKGDDYTVFKISCFVTDKIVISGKRCVGRTWVKLDEEDVVNAKLVKILRSIRKQDFWTWMSKWKEPEEVIKEIQTWDLSTKRDAIKELGQYVQKRHEYGILTIR